MKKSFTGFSFENEKLTQIPASFFTHALPTIQDVNALKTALYIFWWLGQQESDIPYITLDTFTKDKIFMSGLADSEQEQKKAISTSIKILVDEAILLEAVIPDKQALRVFFLNTKKGQAAVKAISQGNWSFLDMENQNITLETAPTNIYKLYEENIGPLTPLIADALKEIEQQYAPDWIEDAFEEAIKHNVRKLKYIEAILQNWQNEGRNDRTDRGRSQKTKKEDDPERYVRGEFSDFIDH